MLNKRLFVALSVPPEIRKALADCKNILPVSGLSWVKEENLHITLLFLGTTSAEAIPVIEKKLASVSALNSFYLACKEMKPVIKRGKLTMLWASFTESPEFVQLATRISQELNHPPDQYPLPHITLARARRGQLVTIPDIPFPSIGSYQWQVQKFGLWESVLSPTGPVYSVVKEWELKGNR